jgi:hypothetical protein
MVFDPKWFFSSLLEHIKQHPPSTLKANVGPHLQSFLANPTIKDILVSSKAPTAPKAPLPDTDLQKIQQSLTTLSKAITDLQKKVSPPSNPKHKGPDIETHIKGKANSPIKSYLAIAGSRPPNPSCYTAAGVLVAAVVRRPLSPKEVYSGTLRSITIEP